MISIKQKELNFIHITKENELNKKEINIEKWLMNLMVDHTISKLNNK